MVDETSNCLRQQFCCLVIAQNAVVAEIAELYIREVSALPVNSILIANPWEPPVDVWPSVSSKSFDLILADVPRSNWAMYDWLREVGAAKQVPIVVGMLDFKMMDYDQAWYDDLQPAAVLPRGATTVDYRRVLRSLDIAVKSD